MTTSTAKKTRQSTAGFQEQERTARFRSYLAEHSKEFAALPESDQNPLASLLYGAGIGRFTHNSGLAGEFPIHHEAKRKLFGSAANFDLINSAVQWFECTGGAVVGKRAASWKLTNCANSLIESYHEDGKQLMRPYNNRTDEDREIVSAGGLKCRKPRSVIASRTITNSSTGYKPMNMPINVYIDGDSLHFFLHAAKNRRFGGECPAGFEWAWALWADYERERGAKALKARLEMVICQGSGILETTWRSNLSGFVLHQHYQESRSGRLVAKGLHDLQSSAREVRMACLPGHYDYDVDCCHYAILSSMAANPLINYPTPKIQSYIANKNQLRREVQMASGGSYSDAKRIITSLIYGAVFTVSERGEICQLIGKAGVKRLQALESLTGLRGELKGARDAVIESYRSEVERTGRITNPAGRSIQAKGVPANKLLSHILTGGEAQILKTCIGFASENIVLLAHDGFVTNEQINIAELEQKVAANTGYKVTYKEVIFPAFS